MEPGTDNSVAAEIGTAPVTAQPLTGGGSGVVFGRDCMLAGWSFRETTGTTTAVVEIYDGAATNSQLVTSISLLAGESTRDYLPLPGVVCQRGVYVSVVSGTVTGAVYVAPL